MQQTGTIVKVIQNDDRALMANALKLAADEYLKMSRGVGTLNPTFANYAKRVQQMSDQVMDCDWVELKNEE